MKFQIATIIERDTKLVFRPSKEFYNSVGINKKRWGQIYRGEKEPILSEVKSISQYFEIPVNLFF